jgi:hypothetical protein
MVLPTMHVALLEAGGPPLLSPPNWPHLVLTLQDCVMVEQRRIFRNVTDEVCSSQIPRFNQRSLQIVYHVAPLGVLRPKPFLDMAQSPSSLFFV